MSTLETVPLGLPHKVIEGHKSGVNALRYCHINKLLITITQDSCLNLWQYADGEFTSLVSYELQSEPRSLAWDATQRLAIIGFTNGKVKVLQLIDAVIELFSVECGEEEVVFVGYDSHSSCVIGVSEVGNFLLLHMPSAVSRLSPLDEGGDILAATYDKERGYVIVGGYNRTVSIYDLFPNKLAVLEEHQGSIRALHYTESMLFVSDFEGLVTAWNIANLSNPGIIFRHQFHSAPVKALAWSPDMNMLFSADTTIFGVNVAQLEDPPLFLGEHTEVTSIYWDEEESMLFTAGHDRRVKTWRLGGGSNKVKYEPLIRRKVSITDLLKTDLLAFVKRGDTKRVNDLVTKVGVPTDATTLEGDTVLHVGARHTDKGLVTVLLNAKQPPNILAQNILGRTPLHEAISKPIAEVLIQFGATPCLTMADREGSTVLHCAVRKHGNVDLIKYYIQLGVDVNQRDSAGRTPLDWSLIYNKNLAHADCLLRNGSNPDLQDVHGNSILHNLVLLKAEARDALTLLLKFKLNINLQNSRGNTPLHLAAALDYEPTVQVLLANGASVQIQNKDASADKIPTANYLLKDNAKPSSGLLLNNGSLSNSNDKSWPNDGYTACMEKLVSKIWGKKLQTLKVEQLDELLQLHGEAIKHIQQTRLSLQEERYSDL